MQHGQRCVWPRRCTHCQDLRAGWFLQAALVAVHRKGGVHHGIALDGGVQDMLELGVVESLHVKATVLRHATEMAVSLVKIDGGPVRIHSQPPD